MTMSNTPRKMNTRFCKLQRILFTISILWATPSVAGPRPLLNSLGLQILGIVASGSFRFWYENLSFGMRGGSISASWGTMGRSRQRTM